MVEKVKEMLGDIVQVLLRKGSGAAEGSSLSEALLILPDIDMPFHSRYLRAGVLPFRACTFFF